MYSIFAALLMIWSMATRLKFQVMNSMIGRRPHMAAPTPRPGETLFGNGSIDHSFFAELFQHPLG